jgi:hypothetical protein
MVPKSFFSAVAVAVIATISQSATAQTSPPEAAAAQTQPPVTREQRKVDTAAANKAGTLTPAGQGGPGMTVPSGSSMTREERKAQTQADAKAGKMAGAGDTGTRKKSPPPAKSTMTRTERKEQAKADQDAGKMKSGEASFK